ncbi:MAG: right-handed parallel beta-helix repeat-containing protein [Candidatus Sulfotelmatobacter sp.]
MIRPRNLLFTLLLVSMLSAFSSASDIYIAQNAAGGNTGADCADAYAVSFFNSAANWGSSAGKIAPGTTAHLCGTITAPAGASGYLTFHGSGATGNPITLLFEAGSVLTAAYWSGCAITMNGNSNITINGGSNGTIQATANGTGLASSADGGMGICSGNAATSNIVVENVTVSNIYQHTCTEPVSNCTDQGGQNTYGMYLWGGSNISVSQNTVHDMKWAIFLIYGTGATTSSNFNVYNNTIYDMDHGVVFGDQESGSKLNSSNCSSAVYNNDFSAMQPWDATGDVNHHDAIHFWANGAPASSYTGACQYSNYFHGAAGATCNTIFGMESYGDASYQFNNVLNPTGTSDACATGLLGHWTGTGANSLDQHTLNNSISPPASSSSKGSQTMIDYEQTSGGVVENNLLLTGAGTYVYTDGGSGDLATADYNYYQTLAGSNPFYGPSGCPSGAGFATWQSGCGFDMHGRNASATVNSAPFTLPSGSAAIGAATNLTSLGITALDVGAPATFGVGGSCGNGCLARAGIGAWDAGAYPYSSSAAPNPPTNLSATVQ